ncbi:MAG: radical SAM domain-containing protein [Parcubacteria group bacterium LiPW_39]|nr:MAG: radical SAM domain-containing protein [Parcubacteria group bacterium LiPW_39]
MNKVILVQINYSQDHSEKILPMGILSVGSALKRHGFEVELINITEKEIDKTVAKVMAKNPLLVALSVMTGRQTKHSAEFSKKIKEHSSVKVLWGGIHPSLLPEQCLNESYIDFVIIGEGEETSVELFQKLERQESLENVLGLGYKQNGKIKINYTRPLISDLDLWPMDFNLLDMEKYLYKLDRYKRVVAYKTSRGCPFNCAFCYNRAFNQSRWRAWSIDKVVNDIQYLKQKYRIDAIKFYDDNFFVDKMRALEILRRINLPAHLEVRIDMIDDELAKELKKLKVFDLLIGVESGSDRLLALINKKITVARIMAAVKSLAKYNVPASYSAIVGLPTETKKEFKATVDLLYQIYKIHPQAAFTLGAYMPYPGSLMYDFAVQQGFLPPRRTEDWGKIDRFRKDFSSPWVNAKYVWRIREYFKLLKLKLGPINKWFEFRIKHRFFSMPLDIYLIEFLAGIAIEEKNWLGKVMRRAYNFLKLKYVK